MDKTRIHIIIIVVLAAGWAISLGYYVQAKQEVQDIRSGSQEITSQERALSVCDDTSTAEKQQACVDQLVRFSGLLRKYEEKLKQINIQG
ncbi:MAG TPA: hypothetical protein VK145_01020 [Candidatus Nanoarchaeia archaeon]|nr:hypothetical protein [Candidatus Nanoarchaeia archaeon]